MICYECQKQKDDDGICTDCLIILEIVPRVKQEIVSSLFFKVLLVSAVLFWGWAGCKIVFWLPRYINQIGGLFV